MWRILFVSLFSDQIPSVINIAEIYMCVLGSVIVGVVVQWLDYLAVTQEPGVRFPTAEKVASNMAPPQWTWDKLHLTSGTADMAMWSDLNSHTVVAHDQSCVEVLGKPLISRRLCPPSSDGNLVERES